jgi:hypothetical protein
MTETTPEYGVRWADGTVHWIDGDGDLDVPGGWIFHNEWEDEQELQRLVTILNQAAKLKDRITLVRRTYTVLDVDVPLPTALGSVISAHIPETDALVRLVRCSDPGTLVWRVVDDIDDDEGIWQYAEDLADVTVLFDASVLGD